MIDANWIRLNKMICSYSTNVQLLNKDGNNWGEQERVIVELDEKPSCDFSCLLPSNFRCVFRAKSQAATGDTLSSKPWNDNSLDLFIQ